MKNSYSAFSKFFIRIPKEPLQLFSNFIKDEVNLKELVKQTKFLEALFIASPELYNETIKWLNGHLFSEKEEQKLKYSLYKYLARMSSRCTPFGLFAGFNVGIIDDSANIPVVNESERLSRFRVTRLDMNYSCALSLYFIKQELIRDQLKFFPNNSIYASANKLRYVEYLYGEKSKRLHQVTAVDKSEYLMRILDFARSGNTINNLSNHIVDDEITFSEAKDFILELIDSQILVSELEPCISDPDYWARIISTLSGISGCEHIIVDLNKIKGILEQLDYQPIGVPIEEYYGEIKAILKKYDVDFDEKFLFQSDMLIPLKQNRIGKDIPLKVLEGIELLSKLSVSPSETNLTKFAIEFNKRYEDLELELTTVLDPETGLGYPVGNMVDSDSSPLLDGLVLPTSSKSQYQIEWDPVQLFLLKKYNETLKDNAFSVELTDEELKDLPIHKNPLSNTISAMVELIPSEIEGGTDRIILNSAGGTTALSLVGRFCHANESIKNYSQEIAEKEIEYFKNCIMAEIVHLPEARTGNILMHPKFFDYEIPYLANSNVDQDHTVELSDLMISVRQNKVVLRSKKYNMQVIPRLSNAHSFSMSSLPVYRFLCDLQSQGFRGGVRFHWGNFAKEYSFLPRVTYKNLILFEATWNVNKKDIESFFNLKNDNELYVEVNTWRNKLRLPDWVTLVDGDNELLIDLTSVFSIRVLLDTIKRRTSFKLKEYLHHPEKNSIKDENGKSYANQLVLAFYKNDLQDKQEQKSDRTKKLTNLFMN
ncbi:MAG: lantibiotic dehydratase family protein [Bacteroidales bacterium]